MPPNLFHQYTLEQEGDERLTLARVMDRTRAKRLAAMKRALLMLPIYLVVIWGFMGWKFGQLSDVPGVIWLFMLVTLFASMIFPNADNPVGPKVVVMDKNDGTISADGSIVGVCRNIALVKLVTAIYDVDQRYFRITLETQSGKAIPLADLASLYAGRKRGNRAEIEYRDNLKFRLWPSPIWHAYDPADTVMEPPPTEAAELMKSISLFLSVSTEPDLQALGDSLQRAWTP